MKNVNKKLLNMMIEEYCYEDCTEMDLRKELKNGDCQDLINDFFDDLKSDFENYSKNLSFY